MAACTGDKYIFRLLDLNLWPRNFFGRNLICARTGDKNIFRLLDLCLRVRASIYFFILFVESSHLLDISSEEENAFIREMTNSRVWTGGKQSQQVQIAFHQAKYRAQSQHIHRQFKSLEVFAIFVNLLACSLFWFLPNSCLGLALGAWRLAFRSKHDWKKERTKIWKQLEYPGIYI